MQLYWHTKYILKKNHHQTPKSTKKDKKIKKAPTHIQKMQASQASLLLCASD